MKKSSKNMIFAFILNLSFSLLEFIGGLLTNSISIISDSLHDLIDAGSIFTSIVFERRSEKDADEKYNYGYARYSVMGAFVTSTVLITASIIIIFNSILRIVNPEPVNYEGMLILAVIGVIVNGIAATKMIKGRSINERALSLHMLEDVLGWAAVLIGSFIIKLTGLYIIDAILSLLITLYIIIRAIGNIKEIFQILLDKKPKEIDIEKIKRQILVDPRIKEVYYIKVRSLDGEQNEALVRASISKNITTAEFEEIKNTLRRKLTDMGMDRILIEFDYA